MSIVLKEVATLRDLRKFVKFSYRLYKNHPYWVPPLIKDEMNTLRWDRNPSFEICKAKYWLAHKNGKTAGRIVGIINDNYIKKWGTKYGRFGWVEFIDDREVSAALFGALEEWFRENGMEGLQGPLGFTDFDKEGMLIEGFEELGTQPMIYNYPYYPQHIEALGYKKDADWLEFEVFTPEEIPARVLRVQELVLKRSGLKLFEAKKTKDMKVFAKDAMRLVNEAYKDLYGFVELTEEQSNVYLKKYFSILDPKYTKAIMTKDNELIAFGAAMPSLSTALQKARGRLLPFGIFHILKALQNPKVLDMYLVAVKPEYQRRGVAAVILGEITREGLKNGIVKAETSGELEDNLQVQALWKTYPARQHKRRRAYLKTL